MTKKIFGPLAALMAFAICACAPSGSAEEGKTKEGGQRPLEKIENTVSEQRLIEQDGVRITLKGFGEGAEWKLLIENDSAKDITVQARDVVINGIMAEAMLSTDVTAGKKANSVMTFMLPDENTVRVGVIKDVSLKFIAFSTENFDTIFETQKLAVACNEAIEYKQQYGASGKELLNRDGFKIVFTQMAQIYESESAMCFYIENNSTKDATIQLRDVSVNGYMMDPLMSCDVMKGTKAYDSATFFNSDLEKNGISEIKNIELSFIVYGMDAAETILKSSAYAVSIE